MVGTIDRRQLGKKPVQLDNTVWEWNKQSFEKSGHTRNSFYEVCPSWVGDCSRGKTLKRREFDSITLTSSSVTRVASVQEMKSRCNHQVTLIMFDI